MHVVLAISMIDTSDMHLLQLGGHGDGPHDNIHLGIDLLVLRRVLP